MITLGLENFLENRPDIGKFGLLCHSAAVDSKLNLGLTRIIECYGDKLVKVFGPQHGFVCDVQDNMIETYDFVHPYFKRPIHSLYGETRIPTDEMLEGLDSIVVDLQEVGTRIYTYVSTLTLLLKKCSEKNIKVIVLDRPNPIGCQEIEGAVLKKEWTSFVGQLETAQRHAMTLGELGHFAVKSHNIDVEYEVISMSSYNRSMHWNDTGLTWVNPSPNLPTYEGCLVFPGTVLFEGTKMSEGRGTTRSLEIIGSPKVRPYALHEKLISFLKEAGITGVNLRPLNFYPMFQKFKETSCGGYHIHPTDRDSFKPWRLGQHLLRFFYHLEEIGFEWQDAPYEYEFKKLAIDLLNGRDDLRLWVEKNGSPKELSAIEKDGMDEFQDLREDCLLYF